MKFEEVKSPYDLEKFIKEWGSNPEEGPYDFGEVFALLSACLDNLKKYALEAEIEDIPEYLTDEQAKFIKKMADYIPAM
jgi:hypothetical protein